jgi:hypothetical protein
VGKLMPDRSRGVLTEPQEHILQALLTEGGLSTAQLMLYVLPDLPNWRIYRELHRLRAAGLVRGTRFYPLEGHKHEVCWTLCAAGARALAQPYPHRHQPYRLPTPAQLAYKSMTLEINAALHDLGWTVLRPTFYNRHRPKPLLTPQSEVVRRAVQHHFAATAVPPIEALVPPVRLHPEQVPAGLNDWVAWSPTAPEQPVVLVLHPPGASRGFWLRPPDRHRRSGNGGSTAGRAHLYKTIAAILPVFAILPNGALVAEIGPWLRPAGCWVGTGADLLPRLASLGPGAVQTSGLNRSI